MGVNPDAAELLRLQTGIDALIEEVGDRGVVETHLDVRGLLTNGGDVVDVEQIMPRRNAEAADFGVAGMAQELELEPREARSLTVDCSALTCLSRSSLRLETLACQSRFCATLR